MSTSLASIRKENALEQLAACDLERMKRRKSKVYHPIPISCCELIRSVAGNSKCVDCEASNPDWVAVSYGALICMSCSARHRSLGVNYSKVRSLTMDHWSVDEVLNMLEGGNEQLDSFFGRHALSTHGEQAAENLSKRYKTKAAKFYRVGIDLHVTQVAATPYEGREASRRGKSPVSASQKVRNRDEASTGSCHWHPTPVRILNVL
jgi:hypothetical protein